MTWMLAVDFGTSNTAAAVRRGDDVRPLSLSGHGFTMPSAVALVDGTFRVGAAALNARLSSPETFEWQPKSLIGTGPVLLGDRTLSPGALVTEVLRHVHGRAMASSGEAGPPARTVVTHPVAWSERQIAELLEAAVAAGFDRQHLLVMNEPVAAAMRSATDDLSPGDRVAVIDWGGGTCDVAVVEFVGAQSGSAFVVRSYSGDAQLGGNHLDARLYDHVVRRLGEDGHDELVADLADPDRLSARLTLADAVRRAKEDLSTYETVTVPIQSGGVEAALTVSRDEYEQLIVDEIARVAELLEEAVQRDHGAPLARILLTGGASQTPALGEALQQSTGVRLERRGDPKLVVAEGALLAQIPPARRNAPPPAPTPSRPHDSSPLAPPARGPVTAAGAAPARPAVAAPRTTAAHPMASAVATEPASRNRGGLIVAVVILTIVVVAALVFGATRLGGGTEASSSPQGPPVCWNGEEPDADGECRPLQGDAALTWAFPISEGTDIEADCAVEGSSWNCTWDEEFSASRFRVDNDHGVKLTDGDIRGRAREILGDSLDEVEVGAPQPLVIRDERVGQRWTYDATINGAPVLRMTYDEYDDIPFRGLLVTEAANRRAGLTSAEQTEHQTLVTTHVKMRSEPEIEQAISGSVR